MHPTADKRGAQMHERMSFETAYPMPEPPACRKQTPPDKTQKFSAAWRIRLAHALRFDVAA